MAFLRTKTSHDHNMADVYSAFQKYVRRGDLDGALYWGSQIGRPKDDYKGYPNALKKRLLQHSLEDVGHIQYALRLLETKTETWESLVPWIALLCSLPKTRAGSWLNRVAAEYIGDTSTAPSLILSNAAKALVLHRDGKIKELEEIYGKPVVKLYREVNKDVLAFHVANLTRAGIIVPAPLPTALPSAVELPDLDTLRIAPDWVYDKHTARGKSLGRGYEHFLETMLVAPRLFPEGDPYEAEAKPLYLNGKEQRVRHILAATAPTTASATAPAVIPGPIAGYTEALQAQPITGKSKPRVWFAKDPTGKQVVIKGPVPKTEKDACLKSEHVKQRLGLPHTNMRVEGAYLVQDSIVDYTKLPTHVVSTALETDIRVPVAGAVQGWDHKYLLDPELAYNVLEALLFRKIVGANDTCTRNFIVIGRDVYSIDDAALGKETPCMWKTKLIKPKAAYEAALTAAWDRLLATMERWRGILADDAYATSMLRAYAAKEAWVW